MRYLRTLHIIVLFFGISLNSFSANEFNLWEDTKESLSYLGKGSYLQFTDSPAHFWIGTGVITFAALITQKNAAEMAIRSEEYSGWHKILSDTNILLSLPVVPLGSYYLAKKWKNNKLKRFAMEYFATLYLTKLEVFTLSFVPVNKRPNSEGINAFEKNFRGNSSFPSGHMVPASTLFFKTFQFYGLLPSLLPAAFTILTGYERVRSGRHHITDVAGTIFLAALASEGVRIASGHKHNHPLYQWIFEHKFSLRFFKGRDVIGTAIDFTF